MVNKVYSMLGLAEKGGHVVSGEFSTERAIKGKKARLVILASDASENTRKHFSDMCAWRNIRMYVYGNKEELGHAIGKRMRVNLAVTDTGLAEVIQERLEEQNAELAASERKVSRGSRDTGREDAELAASERTVSREFTDASAAGNCSAGKDTGREDAELEWRER